MSLGFVFVNVHIGVDSSEAVLAHRFTQNAQMQVFVTISVSLTYDSYHYLYVNSGFVSGNMCECPPPCVDYFETV